MTEKKLLNSIMKIATDIGNRMFRNNVGTGWVTTLKPIRLHDGDMILRNPRPLHSGLCKGSSDLIGFTTITITPGMVGKDVAVFTACEIKIGSDRLRKEQKSFINMVNEYGGIAGEVRSLEDYKDLIQHGHQRLNKQDSSAY